MWLLIIGCIVTAIVCVILMRKSDKSPKGDLTGATRLIESNGLVILQVERSWVIDDDCPLLSKKWFNASNQDRLEIEERRKICNADKLDAHIAYDIMQATGYEEIDFSLYSVEELFELYLQWNGIVGYTGKLIHAYENIKGAFDGSVPRRGW